MSSEEKNQAEPTQQISPTVPLNFQNNNQNSNQNQTGNVQISATNNQFHSGGNAAALSNLKVNSELVTCPNCNYVGNTMVTTKCNCGNLCCCWCTCLVFWICFQLCRGKALSCRDADHRCPRCGTLLAHYEAC